MSSPLKAIGNLFTGGNSAASQTNQLLSQLLITQLTKPNTVPSTEVPTTNPGTNKASMGTSFLSAVAPPAATSNQSQKTLLGQ